MSGKLNSEDPMSDTPSVTLSGTVEKIIPAAPAVGEPEKAQIAVEEADHLYREIRVENVLQDENGKTVGLRRVPMSMSRLKPKQRLQSPSLRA